MRPGTRQTLIDAARRLSACLPARWDRAAREAGKVAFNYRGSRATASRYLQYAIARRTAPLLVARFGTGYLIVDAGDDEIGKRVFLSGAYERDHMAAAVGYLAAAGVPTAGRLFLDVGANVGTSTIDALVRFGFGRALSFEPSAGNVRLLRANLVLNRVDDRAEVHAVALSDGDGTGKLRGSSANSGDQRFEPGAGGVECRRLDALVEEGLFDPGDVGLLWIDVQGHEGHVLRGAKLVVDAGVPVVVEYCPWVLGDDRTDLDAQIVERFSTLVDLRALADGLGSEAATLTPADLPGLAARYQRRGYTDLLLLA